MTCELDRRHSGRTAATGSIDPRRAVDAARRLLRRAGLLAATLCLAMGCRATVERTDRDVAAVIAERQRAALGQEAPAHLPVEDDLFKDPPADAYGYVPHPVSSEIPDGFAPTTTPAPAGATRPAPGSLPAATVPAPTTSPTTTQVAQQQDLFTLTDALAYAQRHQRAYQTAKEDLYLAALALTLERHLWTPTFASSLRTIYGNYGEIQDFDQAMRFVADLSVSQRLPYGGAFTAQAISTLIRDVGQTITASEGSTVSLAVAVPFLRGAGHIASEDLIQLERELTYAVRAFERFRRRQLVEVASAYFNLLREKQTALDNVASVERVGKFYERAREFEAKGLGTVLETQRAQNQYLSAVNALDISREAFRATADRFKLLIGMPVDQPLALEDVETIESIEQQIGEGRYPLLVEAPAARDEGRALEVALAHRLDLLTRANRIDDARRGVAISKNALLPDLDLTATVTWDTDPDHFRLADFSFDRTTWRSELLLSLPLERKAEQNQYRRALIDVRRAQRDYQDVAEQIGADVRSAVNQISLQKRSVEIQERNLFVAERWREYADIRYNDFGDIDIVEYFDAEDRWSAVRNSLNRAKTSLWTALLGFRLATETLRIDENGVQHPSPELGAVHQ